MWYILNKDYTLTAVDALEFSQWRLDQEKSEKIHRIGFDTIQRKDGYVIDVSTVFLGLDHSFSKGATPVVYETCIFLRDSILENEFSGNQSCVVERYVSYEDAQKGHLLWTTKVNNLPLYALGLEEMEEI